MNAQTAPIQKYSHLIKLRDGSDVLIRPLCYDDKEEFINMFNRLTLETKFLRYHYVKLRMTPEEASDYCTLDYTGKFVLVAEKKSNGLNEIVGLGRYDRIGCSSIAELSFLVDDKQQSKGICTNLLVDLTKIAKEKGITRFIGLLTNENSIMLDILRKFKPSLDCEVDATDIIVSFDID